MGLILKKGGANFGLLRRSVTPARTTRILLEGGNLAIEYEGGETVTVDSDFFCFDQCQS
jgi:hypothetical protein